MKKFFLIILSVIFAFTGCNAVKSESADTTIPVADRSDNGYIKSIWIAYYELENFTRNSNEEKFKKDITVLMNSLRLDGFNTVTVQVRPCADAFYESYYFPVSRYFKGKQGSVLEYDPLKIMCDIAESENISIEAWVNPYRVSQDEDFEKLSHHSIAYKWRNTDNIKTVDKKIYFNPASPQVQDLIINGVAEIVNNYNISAIHFDDYFYPTTEKNFDKNDYKKYKDNGGELSLGDWRRKNVNDLIKGVYKAIKGINESVKFGISPSGNIKENYSSLYADVKLWCKNSEYIDYICPQIYYGFKNEKMPFMQTVKNWISVVDTNVVDLYIGLPLYKSGIEDKFASSENMEAINEFKKSADIIPRQIEYISKLDNISGFYLFSYSNYADAKNKKTIDLVKKAMQSSNPY